MVDDIPRFEIIEHPADTGIKAFGGTLEEAFRSAALGLMSLMIDPKSVEQLEERSLRIFGPDREQLLVRWLSEILFLFDGEKFVIGNVKITSFVGNELTAVVKGEPYRTEKHLTLLDVKAITYHNLSIEEVEGIFQIQFVVDI